MVITIRAIYENGVLRPLEPLLGVPDLAEVDLTISIDADRCHHASGLRACMGTISAADAAEMRRAVADEFEKVDECEW